jgi:hypothetical protein
MDRGYRTGRGVKRRGVKRGVCPKCGKKGMTQWKAHAIHGVPCLLKDCQYCGHSETQVITERAKQ